MWILDSDGDYLQGRRMWLKPGKKYLFGRAKKDGVRVAIDHKTVSRKHFVIEVEAVNDEDVGNVHARTKITITDEGSKAGTSIDGHLIRGKSQELRNDVNSIRPGSCSHELLVKWEPCVLTFKLVRKEIKAGLLKAKQDRVKDLDLKVIGEYLPGQTSHLVATKRNTADGLQALIEGRPMVSDAYVEAIIYAATPNDLEQEENLCPLEIDFDEAWPDPAKYLPPVANEPTNQPDEVYKPSTARARIFENFVFVFISQKQYHLLLPPIALGHGKALLYSAESADIDEAVCFMQNAAPKRTFGQEALKEKRGAVVMVHVGGEDETDSWQSTLIEGVARALQQKAVEQKYFLDAILSNNPYQLVHPYNDAENASAGPATSQPSHNIVGQTQQSLPGDASPRPRKRARLLGSKQPLPATFDDDFNPEAIAPYEDEDIPSQQEAVPRSHRANGVIKQEPPSAADQKVNSPSPEHHSLQSGLDELLTGRAAMQNAMGTRKPPAPALRSKAAIKEPKEIKLINVREAVKAKREADEAAGRHERHQAESSGDEDQDNRTSADLVKIVKFDLPVRDKGRSESGQHGREKEWKAEWNGRKNFKRFVKSQKVQASDPAIQRRPAKVIVPLSAVKHKNYGLGDQYWERSQEDKEHDHRERERKRKAQARKVAATQKPGSQRSRRSQTVGNSDEDSGGETVPVGGTSQRQCQAVDTARGYMKEDAQSAVEKRRASQPPQGKPKKQKTLPMQTTAVHGSDSEEDDNDSDDMKFTFGRARKQRA